MKRVRIALSILILFNLFIFIGCSKDKVYKGKELRVWIKQLDDIDYSKRAEAIEAIGEFGPDAKKAIPKLKNIILSETTEYKLRILVVKNLLKIGKHTISTYIEIIDKLEDKNLQLMAIQEFFSIDAISISDTLLLFEIIDKLDDEKLKLIAIQEFFSIDEISISDTSILKEKPLIKYKIDKEISDVQATIGVIVNACRMYYQDYHINPNNIKDMEVQGYLTLSENIKSNWEFIFITSIEQKRIQKIEAISLSSFIAGEGNKISYDLQSETFSGFGFK